MSKYQKTINNRINQNKKKILIYLEKNNGKIKYSCQYLGIHRSTFYRWLKNDKEFRKKVEKIIIKTKKFYGDAFAYELAKSLDEENKKILEGFKYFDNM